MKFYRPRIDRLEARLLMARDFVTEFPYVDAGATVVDSSGSSTSQSQNATTTADSTVYLASNPTLDYVYDAVTVSAGSLTVIGSRSIGQLMVIDQSNSDKPEILYRLRLDIGIQDVQVDGTRAIVLGQTSDVHTQVIAIDLVTGSIVNRLQFGPGMFELARLKGNDAWVVFNESLSPAAGPNGTVVARDDHKLMHLQWGQQGLVVESSLPVEQGIWAAADDRLIMTSDTWLGGVNQKTTIHLYQIGSAGISELATLELKDSFGKSLAISADGQRASLIRGIGDTQVNPKSAVDVLDLSAGTIRVAQSTAVDGFVEVYRHDADMAVLKPQLKAQLVTVDLRSLVSSTSRANVWDLPKHFSTNPSALELSGGRLGISALVADSADSMLEATNSSISPEEGAYLLILDPAGEIEEVKLGDRGGVVYSLESGTDVIGIWGGPDSFLAFTYGQISSQGKFVKQGTVANIDIFRDLPLISSDRLVTVGTYEFAIYDLEQAGKRLLGESISGEPIRRVPPQKHNVLAPLDVNEDGIVTAMDVLWVINAINDDSSAEPLGAIDTNGDGLLQPLDVLLVVNYLNHALPRGDVDEIRSVVLKYELVQVATPPATKILVGFQSPEVTTTEVLTNVYYSEVEIANQFIQTFEIPTSAFLQQAGLKQYGLESSALAVRRDSEVLNKTNNEAVDLILLGVVRDSTDGTVLVELAHNVGSATGASASDFRLKKVSGHWQVVEVVPVNVATAST